MKQSKHFVLIVLVLALLVPVVTASTKEQITRTINRNSWENFEQANFDPAAITTTTFKGVSNVTCFVGPDSAYDLITHYLDKATTSIYLEVYTLSSEPLVNKLIAANSRGVSVIVAVSHDRVSGYEDNYTEEAAYRLDQAGIDVYTTSPTFTYTHAKFWVIDSKWTFVYSGNWAPSSIPQYNGARTNREMGFFFDDTNVAAYYEGVFLDDVSIASVTTGVNHGPLQANETSGTYTHPFDTPETIVEYMEITPVFSPDNSYTLLKALLDSANSTIDVELQYIKFDCYLLNDLINAAKRGVAIRVLIPEPGSATENVTQLLFDNGISVKFFKGLGHNHNKYINVDNKIVSVSSINWSNNSVVNNREAGAIVRNTNVATYFKTVFDYDWANSEVPTGFSKPLSIVSPSVGEIAAGNYNFQVNFAANTFTSAQFLIDNVAVHTFANPAGLMGHPIDLSGYTNGIHIFKVVATPTAGEDQIIEVRFNIIAPNLDWLVLISEVRYDAVTEPNGEFFEVYNGFDFNVLLGGWVFTDNEDDYTLPDDTIISADNMLIFVRDTSAFTTEMTNLGVDLTGITPDIVYNNLQLGNTGDELIMKDSTGTIRDAVLWGSGSLSGHTPWTGTMNEDLSLHRDPANSDTNDCLVDFKADTPDPGVVYITAIPSGFIPGFVFSTTLLGIIAIILAARFIRRKRK
ncbi:MAG: phospholipase D-like domain-containing protein [Candidatus Heimdallarchaeota archaeon]